MQTGLSISGDSRQVRFKSPFLEGILSLEKPELLSIVVDSLGKRTFPPIPLRSNPQARAATAVQRDNLIEYRRTKAPSATPARWTLEIFSKAILLRSAWTPDDVPEPFHLEFDPKICHATLLGRLRPAESGSKVQLPAVLHLPDRGSFRVTSNSGEAALDYDARRSGEGYVRIAFPPATPEMPQIEYRLEITAIHPPLPGMESDALWDGFRRSWLNILQINPRLAVLANHAASDSCPFCYYEYADMAAKTPPLADGLTALDLVRESLERYLGGQAGYGMPGYHLYDTAFAHESARDQNNTAATRKADGFSFLDVYPSLLIAVADYVNGRGDHAWFARQYKGIRGWADELLGMDRDGNGLVEYPVSGNSGSWPPKVETRPSNWWDTIGFGHEDAYANALAYRALTALAPLCEKVGHAADAVRYRAAADKLRKIYRDTFLNPKTGVLAGWRSRDGELHDYWFLWINGIAICYGLVEEKEAHEILDRLLKKMKEVGYSRFDLGLPGNLVPVMKKDYVHLERRWGGGEREDNTDGFQIYENGGATGSFAYFLLAALYKLGRREEADRIFFPMLDSFDKGSFQGRAENGMTHDWKAWDGTAWGYEGFLVDNYYALLAALERAGENSRGG